MNNQQGSSAGALRAAYLTHVAKIKCAVVDG